MTLDRNLYYLDIVFCPLFLILRIATMHCNESATGNHRTCTMDGCNPIVMWSYIFAVYRYLQCTVFLQYSMYILLFPLWKKSNCNRLGHEPNVSTCQICCPLVTRLALNQFKGAAAVKKRPSVSQASL